MAVFDSPDFVGVSLSGSSNSASFLADRIVAAIKIANFLSSVMGGSALGYAAENGCRDYTVEPPPYLPQQSLSWERSTTINLFWKLLAESSAVNTLVSFSSFPEDKPAELD